MIALPAASHSQPQPAILPHLALTEPTDAGQALELTFPAGIPGFPGRHGFQLVSIKDSFFRLLRCSEDADLAFFVVPIIEQFFVLKSTDRAAACRLCLFDLSCTDFMAIVTAARGRQGIDFFANLRAPLLIETSRRIGVQVVLADPAYALRHPIRSFS